MTALESGIATRWPLAGFQLEAVEGIVATVKRVAEHHTSSPEHRREISLKSGVALLESPTGSGKTLIVGRALEALRGELGRKCLWFWFAPYARCIAPDRIAATSPCSSRIAAAGGAPSIISSCVWRWREKTVRSSNG